jgi:hypothetical protein
MSANDERVPSYYSTKYLHWDFVVRIPLGYFEGCTTKYVTRWRKKDGMKDLQKALHFLDKLIEVSDKIPRYNFITHLKYILVEVSRFAYENQLTDKEEEYVLLLCTYQSPIDLEHARTILMEIIDEASHPGTPEDGGHHERFLSNE